MKHIKFYLIFTIIWGCVLLGAVEKTFAVKLEGFYVRDDSIAARYLSAFLEDPDLSNLEGSISAYYVGEKQKAEAALQTHFPAGDPSPSLRTFMRDSNPEDQTFEGHYTEHLQQCADYQGYNKKLQKNHKMIAGSLGIKPLIVELAQAVEEKPESFQFWDSTKLKEISLETIYQFPLTAWGHSLQPKLAFFQEFARENIKIYNQWNLSDFSTQKREKYIKWLVEMPFITRLMSQEELEESFKISSKHRMRETHDPIKLKNALFVVEEVLQPILQMMGKIREEALEKKAPGSVAPAPVPTTVPTVPTV